MTGRTAEGRTAPPHSPAEGGLPWPWDYCPRCGLTVPVEFMTDQWYCPHCLLSLEEDD